MKFDQNLQIKIDEACREELKIDPFRENEFEEFYNNLNNKTMILKLVLTSHELGLDLTSLQCFLIWECLSSNWGCSGFMDIPYDGKLQSMFKSAIELYLN